MRTKFNNFVVGLGGRSTPARSFDLFLFVRNSSKFMNEIVYEGVVDCECFHEWMRLRNKVNNYHETRAINFISFVADPRSSISRLPRWLLGENFQSCRFTVQRFGHSLSRRVVVVQATLARTLEEELRWSAEEEIACGAEWKLSEQSRVH